MPKNETEIDDALYDGLQKAKKNPRYYCVIAKGADVVGLCVQKKPINDAQAQNLKKELKGNLLIQGVCHVNGDDLTLEVLEAEPSTTTKKIKEFVNAQTKLTLKPRWSVVPQFSQVVDEDNQVPAAANPTTTASTSNQATTPTDSQNLQERLKSLVVRY